MNDHLDADLGRRFARLASIQPSPDSTHRALARVRETIALAPPRLSWQHRLFRSRLVAAALLLILAGGLLALLPPATSPAHAAFVEVQAALKATRSLTCRQVRLVAGEKEETTQLYILGDGRFRAESADGSCTVADFSKNITLAIPSQGRVALLLRGQNLPPINPYEQLKNLPADTSARPLPGKQIDGKEVLGYAVKLYGQEFTVWADARTRLPVQLESQEKNDKGQIVRLIIDRFVFDKEIDPKLFSLEPPPGFTLREEGTDHLPAPPTDPALRNPIVTPLVGIGPVRFGMSRDEVEKLLGKADSVKEVGQNGYVDMNYGSRGYFLGVSKSLGVVLISCVAQEVMAIRVRSFTGKTDKGISLGASLADTIKTLGAPDSRETNQGSTYLSYDKLKTNLTFFGDKLVQMQFSRPR